MIEPAYLWIPPRVGSYGDEAVDLARLAGRELDDEQCLAVDAFLSYGPGGRWAALESAILESRQNGKTAAVLLPVTLFDLYLLPPDRIVWTAHQFRTARDAFEDFCVCIEFSSELSRRTKHISYSHGEEFIETTQGARLEFLARSQGGGRGLGGKRTVLDEALILSSTAIGSLIPTLSARPDPQINYGSSAPTSSPKGVHLHKLIQRGRPGGDPSLIYVEWRAPGSWSNPPCERGRDCPHTVGTEGCALDDESLWPLANHSIGRTRSNGTGITYEYVRAERRAMDADPIEFGRERLGWEEEPEDATCVIDLERWARWYDPQSAATGPVCFSLDVHPELTSAAIGMTGRRKDELLHWQVLEHRAGMSWAVGRAKELDEVENVGWVVDPDSPAGALIAPMEKAGLTVHTVSGRDKAQACTSILNAASDGSGRHCGELDPALTQAWRDAKTVDVGDGVRFTRKKSSGDITPLMVVTLSDHGFRVHGETEVAPWAVYA